MKTIKDIALAALTAIVLTTACSEDAAIDSHRGDHTISIEFKTATPTINITRSADSQCNTVELKDSLGVSLRLDVSVTDGFSFCQEPTDIDYVAPYASITRGSVITTENIATVGVTAYDHTANFSTSTVTVATNGFGFSNVQFNVDADYVGTPSPARYWPTSDHMLSFFAYAPASAVTVAQTTGYPSFTYTVPTTLTDQKDLLVSKLTDQVNSVKTDGFVGRPTMTFDHALAAILFTFGDIGIKEGNVVVTLSDIKSEATFSYETMSWSGLSTAIDYSTVSHPAVPGPYSQISDGGNNVMFLLPQTISDDATINVRYEDSSGNKHVYSDKLKNIGGIAEWKAGKTYTYTVGTTTAKVTSMAVSYPSWKDVDTDDDVPGLITQYESDESFGLFAVNMDGKIVISNEQVTLSDDGSNVAMPLKSTTFYSSDYVYYLMYPYDENITTTYPALAINKTSPGNTAEQFFASVISGWSIPTDQNTSFTLSDLRDIDLQVGAVTDIGSASRSFLMKHAMGLAKLDMTSGKSVPDTRTYTFTGGTNSTYEDSPTETAIYPVHSFKTTTGYVVPMNATTASTDCYYMVKATAANANSQVKVGCATAEAQTRDYWSDVTISGIGYGKCKTIPVTSDRECINFVGLFPYKGQYQQVTLPWTGRYKMECWGGGLPTNTNYKNGCCGGGYVKGSISFDRNMVLFVYVGEGGKSSSSYAFNGGGPSSPRSPTYTGAGGTDIRTTRHSDSNGWSGVTSMRSRIIVAGGGAFTSYDGPTTNTPYTYVLKGGCAGGLVGYDGRDGPYHDNCGKGGTQTAGGASPASFGYERGGVGQFGYGGDGKNSGNGSGGSGGGGGWYGGSGASGAGSGSFGAGGGSSFISGHTGCNGINSSGTHQGASKPSKVLYQGTGNEHTVSFVSGTTQMIDGGGYAWTSTSRGNATQMPKPAGGYYDSGFGHPGNGYAKITSED